MKPTQAMISAVLAVPAKHRKAAARVAERTFLRFLKRLRKFDDYDQATNIEMAGEAAAAEVNFRFA